MRSTLTNCEIHPATAKLLHKKIQSQTRRAAIAARDWREWAEEL
jgi:hypothetical protein